MGEYKNEGDLFRMICHEALRLWQDRMINEEDRAGVIDILKQLLEKVSGISIEDTLKMPLIFTNLNQNNGVYRSVDPDSFST